MKRKFAWAGLCAILVAVFGFTTWGERSRTIQTKSNRLIVTPDLKLVAQPNDSWCVVVVADAASLTNAPSSPKRK